MAAHGKYKPLLEYLQTTSTEGAVTLSLAAIESLIGQTLPASAGTASFWTHAGVARANWERIGFQALLSRKERCVTFTRR